MNFWASIPVASPARLPGPTALVEVTYLHATRSSWRLGELVDSSKHLEIRFATSAGPGSFPAYSNISSSAVQVKVD